MPSLFAIVFGSSLTLALWSCSTPNKPSQLQAYIKQGNELAKDGLLREAAGAYKKALAKNPSSSVARRNYGIVQLRLKNYKIAVRNLEIVVPKFERDFETNFSLAEAYRATDRNADAIFRYKKALEIKSGDLPAMKALAWTYYKVRYYSEALTLAKQLAKDNPSDLQVSLILARTQIKINNSDEALVTLKKAKTFASDLNVAYLNSVEGDAYLAQHRCTDAIRSYRESLKLQPLLPGPLLGLGQCHMEAGKTTDGIGYIERAVRIKPDFTEAVYLLAKAYEQTNDRRAIAVYKKFRLLAAKDPEFIERIAEANTKLKSLQAKSDNSTKL